MDGECRADNASRLCRGRARPGLAAHWNPDSKVTNLSNDPFAHGTHVVVACVFP